MKAKELFEALRNTFDNVQADHQIASMLGLSRSRVTTLNNSESELTAKQLGKFIKKISDQSKKLALLNAIKPFVEMYPIKRVPSKREAKMELLATSSDSLMSKEIKNQLKNIKGIYIFFDSQGRAIYAGKAEKQNIWDEMTSAFNRTRANHTAFFVNHPTTGEFKPAWVSLRQPAQQVVHLHQTASYFSAYEVSVEFIPQLEAFVIRSFCNSLSNKRMEKFKKVSSQI